MRSVKITEIFTAKIKELAKNSMIRAFDNLTRRTNSFEEVEIRQSALTKLANIYLIHSRKYHTGKKLPCTKGSTLNFYQQIIDHHSKGD